MIDTSNILILKHNVNQERTPAYLKICNNPQKSFRFRYAVETNGTQHGCLMAESQVKNKKEFIQVQVCSATTLLIIR